MCHGQRSKTRPPSPDTRRDDSRQPRLLVSKSNRLFLYLIVFILCVETITRLFVHRDDPTAGDNDDDFGNAETLGLFSWIYDGSYSIRLAPLPEQAPTHLQKKITGDNGTIFDIISIGTLFKPELQQAQYETFGSHPSVRNFYRMNESNDTDTACASQLTMDDFQSIQDICTRTRTQPAYLTTLLRNEVIFHPKPSTGWLCAQKRPIDGLYIALQRFLTVHKNETDLPHYLFIIDDDTYINMNYMIHILPYRYPYDKHYLLTGCLLNSPKSTHFLFPFGGYGSILSRKVIERLVQPIHCSHQSRGSSSSSQDASNSDEYESSPTNRKIFPEDQFNDRACWRLQQNLLGEQAYFRNGMSILELMYNYSSNLQYTKFREWGNGSDSDGTSFCFHSDQALGYFFGFYHIGVPDHTWFETAPVEMDDYHPQDHPVKYDMTNDTLRIRYSYREIKIPGKATCKSRVGRYNNKHGKCHIGIDPFCHNVDSTRMHDLYHGP